MIYAVEAWTYHKDEEPDEEEMIQAEEFQNIDMARNWAWQRMEEGFSTRMYRR